MLLRSRLVGVGDGGFLLVAGVLDSLLAGDLAKDDRLEQGVRAESVAAVNADTRHLTGGEEPLHAGPAG